MITSLNSLRGFYGEGALPGTTSRRFFAGDRAIGGPPGPKKQSNISNEKENSMAERSVNKAILVGRLGADAETRFTQNGTPVSRVSLAMNRQWTDSDKQVHEETDWMSIVIWNKENLGHVPDQRHQAVCRRAPANALLRRQGRREAVRHRGRGREPRVARWNRKQQLQRQRWRWERKIRTSSDPGQALEWSPRSRTGARRAGPRKTTMYRFRRVPARRSSPIIGFERSGETLQCVSGVLSAIRPCSFHERRGRGTRAIRQYCRG